MVDVRDDKRTHFNSISKTIQRLDCITLQTNYHRSDRLRISLNDLYLLCFYMTKVISNFMVKE